MKILRNITLAVFLALTAVCCVSVPEAVTCDGFPLMEPDYTFVTIPENISPLNFRFPDADGFRVKLSGGNSSIEIKGKKDLRIPISKWRNLLLQTDTVLVKASVNIEGQWQSYSPFCFYVSHEPIAPYIAYRKINPGYEKFGKMGLYTRSLSDFGEKPIIENTLMEGSCVNCHSFASGNPQTMQFHIRGIEGSTILKTPEGVERLNTSTSKTLGSCVYPYWHPSEQYIAYSVNTTRQSFLNNVDEVLEVCDLASDIVIFDVQGRNLILDSLLMQNDVFETFPAFSPDGRKLYYCAAAALEPGRFREIKYALYEVDFDPSLGRLTSSPRLLYDGDGQSVSFPRPSPDGRYLMFTRSSFGNFSIWHRDADLWLLDLETGEKKPINEINSQDTESYHAWDPSSSWVVFSSRRGDGLHTRLYLSLADGRGGFTKPFVLPQKDPSLYDRSILSYNVPEFVLGEVGLSAKKILKQHIKNIEIR